MKLKIINPAEHNAKRNVIIATLMLLGFFSYIATYSLSENHSLLLKDIFSTSISLEKTDVVLPSIVVFLLFGVYLGFVIYSQRKLKEELPVDRIRELNFNVTGVSFIRYFSEIESKETFLYTDIEKLHLEIVTGFFLMPTFNEAIPYIKHIVLKFFLKNGNTMTVLHKGDIDTIYKIMDLKCKLNDFTWKINGSPDRYSELVSNYEANGRKITLTKKESRGYVFFGIITLAIAFLGISDIVDSILYKNPTDYVVTYMTIGSGWLAYFFLSTYIKNLITKFSGNDK